MKIDFRNDFWDGLSPVLVKELRQGLRSGWFTKTYIIIQILLCLLIVFQAINGLFYENNDNTSGSDTVGGFYWTIVGFLLFVRAPFLAMNGVSQEIQGKTLELLALTRQTSRRLLWGKWMSIMIQSILMVVTILPYGMSRYYFGQINVADELLILFMMLCGSGLIVAMGLSISPLSGIFKAFIGIVSLGFLISVGEMMSHYVRFDKIEWLSMLIMTLGAIALIFFLLELGASWIAPISENTALRLRSSGLGLCLVTGLAYAFDLSLDILGVFSGITLTALAFLLFESLRDCRKVQWAHVRQFLSWPKPIRWIELMFYPGWQSGLIFSIVLLGISSLLTFLYGKEDDRWKLIQLLYIVLGALLTPSLFISQKWWKKGQGLWSYLIFQISLAAPMFFLIPIAIAKTGVFYILAFLPPSGLIIAIFGLTKESFFDSSENWILPENIILIILLWNTMIIIAGLTLSFPYWKRISNMKALGRPLD